MKGARGRAAALAVLAAAASLLAPAARAQSGGAERGVWLAGDLHVHTCYSHDAYCGPSDDNTGPDEFYTLSAPVEERFVEASVRGLDFLAITDHDDVRSSSDPGFGTHGVLGLPDYESSIQGHAQMHGATRLYDRGDRSAAAANAMADALRADGGLFQLNHPTYRGFDPAPARFRQCTDEEILHWRYGAAVRPDTLEVWNPSELSIRDSVRYWECWLQEGERIPATGGSDSHWVWLGAVQGPGNPTTWVLSRDRTIGSVLAGMRDGRTAISRQPPDQGGVRLLLEADADRNGSYASTIGDVVPPGTPMQVRMDTGNVVGTVRVRANHRTLVSNAPLGPGRTVDFDAPDEPGWVRAELHSPGPEPREGDLCDFDGAPHPCLPDHGMAALTSPIWLDERARPRDVPGGGIATGGAGGTVGPAGGSEEDRLSDEGRGGRPRFGIHFYRRIGARAGAPISFRITSTRPSTATFRVARRGRTEMSTRRALRRGKNRVSLGDLPAGRYVMHVSARATNGRSAFRRAILLVRSGLG
jgi:hypothetical protein